ncbi:hypothetical protein FRB98_006986 [Tulasnella sp. 332]|nr:hypothetical protein FRB98_006986 [Tulasnella sp. 332]
MHKKLGVPFGKKTKKIEEKWDEITRTDVEAHKPFREEYRSLDETTYSWTTASSAITVTNAPEPPVVPAHPSAADSMDIATLSRNDILIGIPTLPEAKSTSQSFAQMPPQDPSMSLSRVDPATLRAAWDPAMKVFVTWGSGATEDGEIMASITDNEILNLTKEVALRKLFVGPQGPPVGHEDTHSVMTSVSKGSMNPGSERGAYGIPSTSLLPGSHPAAAIEPPNHPDEVRPVGGSSVHDNEYPKGTSHKLIPETAVSFIQPPTKLVGFLENSDTAPARIGAEDSRRGIHGSSFTNPSIFARRDNIFGPITQWLIPQDFM